MKPLRIYMDTSVVGGCFDPEFADDSTALMEMARRSEVVLVVSDLLLEELTEAPPRVLSALRSLPVDSMERVEATREVTRLHRLYMEAGVLGRASSGDALHVALATVSRVDVIVSWNFKHIVHFDKIRGFNAVNLREGYMMIDIRSPKEVV